MSAEIRTTKEADSLKGAVHTIEVKFAEVYGSGDEYTERLSAQSQVITYDEAGRKTEEIIYAADGLDFIKTRYSYGDAGRLVQKAEYNRMNAMLRRRDYVYNNEGEVTEELLYGGDGSLISRAVRDSRNTADRHRYCYSGTYSSKATFHENESTTEVVCYEVEDSPLRKIVCLYDADQRLAEETEYISDLFLGGEISDGAAGKSETVFASNRRYTYDAGGKLVEESSHAADGRLLAKSIFKYDEQGNIIERINYRTGHVLKDKLTYQYEFDSQGNWIKQVISEAAPESLTARPLAVTYRIITYY